jgi:uncharacterized membrane protein
MIGSAGPLHGRSRGAMDVRRTARERSMTAYVLAVVAITALALGLRAWPLAATYCLDEVTSVVIATLDWTKFVHLVSAREANMSLYYLLLKGWTTVGVTEAFVRSLSILFALATIPMIAALGATMFDRRVGLIGALFLAVNPLHIAYSQVARSYSLLVFLVTLSTFLFIRALRDPTRRRWAAYTVASICAIYSHFFGVFVLLAQWASLRWTGWTVPRKTRTVVISAIGLSMVPLVLFVLTQDIGQVSWVPRPTVSSIPHLFVALVGGGTPRALVYLALCLAALVVRPSRFLAASVVVPVGLVFVISLAKPLWQDYYFLICLPPLLLLAAVGLTRIPTAPAVIAAAVLVTAPTLYHDLRGVEYHGEDWRGAIADVLAGARAGDAILFYHPYTRQAFEFYRARWGFPERGDILLPAHWDPATAAADVHDPDASLFRQVSSYARVWFFNAYSDTAQRRPVADRLQSWLTAQYPFRQSQHFHGPITVTVYGTDMLSSPTTTARYPVARECP